MQNGHLEPLFADIIFRNKLTHIVGDPGIGKTTFTYAFSLHIGNAMEFIGFQPERPLKVLIVDFESDESLAKKKYDSIVGDMSCENVRVVLEQDQYIDSTIMWDRLDKGYKEFPFDIMFVDNQGTAFPIKDENDNAEAVVHVKNLRKIAQAFNCGVVLYHHPSKANLEGGRKSSGAFAWSRYCDISLNMVMYDTEQQIVHIETNKNRLVEDPEDMYIQKMGMGIFERLDNPPVSTEHKYPSARVAEEILKFHGFHTRAEILNRVKTILPNYSIRLIDKVLGVLKHENIITSADDMNYGTYRIP